MELLLIFDSNRMRTKSIALSLILLAGIFALTGCRKEPVTARFTTDKDTYSAGETVHCTNTSINARTLKWTAPDGTTYTSGNLDYTLDSATLSSTKTFTLEVTGNGDNSTYSKSVNIKELILQTDYFAVGNTTYIPTTKSCEANSPYWIVTASPGYTSPCYNDVAIIFFGTFPPSAGNYALQSNYQTLTIGQAFIKIGAPTGIECAGVNWYISTSGSLNVSYTGSGKLHITFSNIPSTLGPLISGDITCH